MFGKCLCGDVQFFSEIRTDPFKIYQCHCSLCKKQSGIEDDVIFASSVFVGDHTHGRSRTDIAYKYQTLEDLSPITIGRGSWIGEHVVILPGVSIGEFAIVGANSVVTDDVPPRSIAVGSPSRVVKVWSEDSSAWVSPERSESK